MRGASESWGSFVPGFPFPKIPGKRERRPQKGDGGQGCHETGRSQRKGVSGLFHVNWSRNRRSGKKKGCWGDADC